MGDASTSPGTDGPSKRPFFGRAADLNLLLTQAHAPGVTVLVGRPRCGKTRLFLETRDRLVAEGVVVGYAEADAYRPDLAARALADAYAAAMAQTKCRQALEHADSDLTARLARVSGAARAAVLPAPLLEVPGRPWRASPRPAERGLEPALLAAADLQGLVSFLSISGDRPVVLFLDGWTAAPESRGRRGRQGPARTARRGPRLPCVRRGRRGRPGARRDQASLRGAGRRSAGRRPRAGPHGPERPCRSPPAHALSDRHRAGHAGRRSEGRASSSSTAAPPCCNAGSRSSPARPRSSSASPTTPTTIATPSCVTFCSITVAHGRAKPVCSRRSPCCRL